MIRRNFIKLSAAAFTVLCLPLTGCPSKTTIAQFVTLIGNDAAQLATYFGQTALAAQIKALAAQIATDIANWQAGSSAQLAIQAIQDLIGLIGTIPIAAPYAPLINLLLSALAGLLLLLPGTTGASVPHIVNGHIVVPMHYPDASDKAMAKAKKDFTAQWEALTATAPVTR